MHWNTYKNKVRERNWGARAKNVLLLS